jgi:hypothetical protein
MSSFLPEENHNEVVAEGEQFRPEGDAVSNCPSGRTLSVGTRRRRSKPADLSNTTQPVYERRKRARKPPVANQGQLFAQQWPASKAGSSAPAAAPDRSAASGSEHRTAAAAGGSGPLFQYYGHCCNKAVADVQPDASTPILRPEQLGEVVGSEYRIRPCRCRRWFCRYCGPRLGQALRQNLIARLRKFKQVFGITLTVDGKLFADPQNTWSYVMEERLIWRLVRDLSRRGYLNSPVYFWVVEFQKETEQPHWHLLLDAEYIPFGEIVEIWSRFRPDSATPCAQKITAENYRGEAPAFGSVQFTPSDDSDSAASYATKYLVKYPKKGYPHWVLDRFGRMPRFGHSHGFFPKRNGHDGMCFCDECRGEAEAKATKQAREKPSASSTLRRPRLAKTIRQRLEQCGKSCTIVSVSRVQLSDGTIVDGKAKYDGKLELSFQEACEFLGLSGDGRWQIELEGQDVTALEEYAASRKLSQEAA